MSHKFAGRNSRHLDPADNFQSPFVLLLSPSMTSAFAKARSMLVKLDETPEEDSVTEILERPVGSAMYQNSLLSFNMVVEELEVRNHVQNKFYSPTLMEKILKHYLSCLPFWAIFVSRLQDPSAKRSNNTHIERSFRSMRDGCEYEKKCVGRYAEFRSEMVDSLANQVKPDQLPKAPRLHKRMNVKTQLQEANLSQEVEQCNKKRRSQFSRKKQQSLNDK